MIEHLDEEETRAKIAKLEDTYPDFPVIFADAEMPQCCKLDEVADRYGWGWATDAWDEYDTLRWLLGDR